VVDQVEALASEHRRGFGVDQKVQVLASEHRRGFGVDQGDTGARVGSWSGCAVGYRQCMPPSICLPWTIWHTGPRTA
jgi:hypothetical protein